MTPEEREEDLRQAYFRGEKEAWGELSTLLIQILTRVGVGILMVIALFAIISSGIEPP